MRLCIVFPVRFYWVCMAIGLFVFSTVIPVSSEETSPPVKSTETTSTAPSLADVVYRAGSLGQRLDALKTRIDTVDGLRKMEQRLERAKTQTDLFHTRLGAINADDLQSYQQLAALRGEVRGEVETLKRMSASLTESIQEVESRRRNWLTEKNRWDGWRSQLGADLSLKSVADAFTRADTEIDQATENPRVLKDPQPMVLFLNFGDSSLDFQLRVWIADFNDRRIIQSALIREIDRRFRAEGVEIPFPQRDLHLHGVDGKVSEGLKGGQWEAADPHER